ncbi:Adaptive-response sensory-kinase SasA [Pseudoalteromonas sp. CIP111854]|uniref:histidine kinase n=1 Tax=Pseudoalteromonas holothuriae TaxID=2963714 RepID=A0A9W4QQP7_9GAMM|nr:ATP-binding protein [Pseudoalteromonas sp. CIP111854]CAH9049413.1 Adaptive-response sensory-kinase SasA [Pseudoalteromonas sp. CIP111854]
MFNNNAFIMTGYLLAAVSFATIGALGLLHSHMLLLSLLAVATALVFIRCTTNLFKRQQQQFNEIMSALKYRDSSFRISAQHTLDKHMIALCNELIQQAQADKREQTEQIAVFESMLQHIDTGVILAKNNDQLLVCNNSAKRLLNIRHLTGLCELLKQHSILEQTKSANSTSNELLFKYFNFTYQDNQFDLWLCTPISEQIESTQIDSWQKLIRVLTHEIGNSVAPIYSLSNTLITMTEQQLSQSIDNPELVSDYLQSLQAIGVRSKSLLGFIESYRKLTHIPQLDISNVKVQTLIDDVISLMKNDFEQANITLRCNVEPPTLSINADKKMLEQVLLNLLTNAKDALAEDNGNAKQVTLSAQVNRYAKCEICIHDNGKGIDPNALDKIFVPFFTTKPSGSGIGLALSQQIIHHHKGRLKVASTPEAGTSFTMVL